MDSQLKGTNNLQKRNQQILSVEQQISGSEKDLSPIIITEDERSKFETETPYQQEQDNWHVISHEKVDLVEQSNSKSKINTNINSDDFNHNNNNQNKSFIFNNNNNNNEIIQKNNEILFLENDIFIQIKEFETFFINYLQQNNKMFDINHIQVLISNINKETNLENWLYDFNQILETSFFTQEQIQEIKIKLENQYNLINQKKQKIINEKISAQTQYLNETLKKKIEISDPIQILINEQTALINKIIFSNSNSCNKDIVEQMIFSIKSQVESNKELNQDIIVDIIKTLGLQQDQQDLLLIAVRNLKTTQEGIIKNQVKEEKNNQSINIEDFHLKQLNILESNLPQQQQFQNQQYQYLFEILKENGVNEQTINELILSLSEKANDDNSFNLIEQFLKNKNLLKEQMFEVFKKWLLIQNFMNEKKKQLILEIQTINFSNKSELVEISDLEQLIKALQDGNDDDVDEMFDKFKFSHKQAKQVLQIWKQYQEDGKNNMLQPEILQFKQFVISQIKNRYLRNEFNYNTAQILYNLLNTTKLQYSDELSHIYDHFELTKDQTKLIQQEFEKIFQFSNSSKHSSINVQEKVQEEREIIEKSKKIQKDQLLSDIYTIAYQQEDHCLDQANIKVICDFNQIQELLKQTNLKELKTIGFYGDYLIAVKIIQYYFPKATKITVPNDYQPPEFDKLVAFTDSQVIFLILQENRNTFEGNIFENEEGQLYIRFLLDTCSIIVTCLNQKQVSSWSNINPFEKFDSIVPPKEIKDRSTIILKQAKIKCNILNEEYNYVLSNDQNPCIFRFKLKESSLIDSSQHNKNLKIFDINKQQISLTLNNKNIYQTIEFDKLIHQMNNIVDIFNLHSESQIKVKLTYAEFQSNLQNFINSYINKETQYFQENYFQKNIQTTDQTLNIKNKNEDDILNNDDFICECSYKDLKCQYESKKNNSTCSKCINIISINEQINLQFNQNILEQNAYCQKYQFNYNQLNPILIQDLVEIFEQQKNNKITYKQSEKYLVNNCFHNIFKKVKNNVQSELQILYDNIQFKQKNMSQIVEEILDFICLQTHKIISKLSALRNTISIDIRNESHKFLKNLEKQYKEFIKIKEKRYFISPLQITYDPSKKDEVFINKNSKINNQILSNSAHEIVDYISYDDQVDYLVYNNSQEKVKNRQRTYIYFLKKNKLSTPQKAFCFSGIDSAICVNQYSKQWVVFSNDTQRLSIGKINQDYKFEEGRIDVNIYHQCTQQGNLIQRVDSCIILNEKNNLIYLFEKQKNQFYELFLNGTLKEVKFDLTKEELVDGVQQLLPYSEEELGKILQIKNSPEADIFVFQTEKYLIFTNPNYTIKNQIILKENFSSFKFVSTDSSLLILIQYQKEYECYIIQGSEDSESISSHNTLDEEKKKIGNIVIDKVIKSMHHYGSNFQEIGCPEFVYQLFFYEDDEQKTNEQFQELIDKYIYDCISNQNIQFKLIHHHKNNYKSIEQIVYRIDSLLNVVNPIQLKDLQFILSTRIPLQLTTIQQSNYLPLKDGLFKHDLMNIQISENQIEMIKKQITLGWIENIIQFLGQKMYVVAMCGRQSVGKSSQLNRIFGTRFGVSASRCTDGIWVSLSKFGEYLILVMDCEGLFSIRRTDDEEVKLLKQITQISDITIVFCDIEGVSQPLLSLFKKLQMCSGKKQSDSYFQGSMVLLTKNVQDEGDRNKLYQESENHLKKKETKQTFQNIFKKGISYAFLKNYLNRDFDTSLKNVRNELLYKNILLKNNPKESQFLLNLLKYSMIQIYLDDDQDIEVIQKQAEIEDLYKKFTDLFYDISEQNFIKDNKLDIQFEYNPRSNEEQMLIDNQQTFKYQSYDFSQNETRKDYSILNQFDINQITNIKRVQDEEKNDKVYQQYQNNKISKIFQINQRQIKLTPQSQFFKTVVKNSQNREDLEIIFSSCFRQLERANFNNYYEQMQLFFNLIFQQRKLTIQEYFSNRMPKEFKFIEMVVFSEQKLQNVLNSLDNEIIICKQKCFKCNRHCINTKGHQENCSCQTSHKCFHKCDICNTSNECFLISGHQGIHFCRERDHHCKQPCQISPSCKDVCTLQPHQEDVLHSCQGLHICEHKCRLFDKCGRSCSLESGHEEVNHICDQKQCFDKCELCDKMCSFSAHDHDILLKNIEKNKNLLMKDGKLITKHLCGNQHQCKEKCEKPGICNIVYTSEAKIWQTSTASKFEYQFIKPEKSQKECSISIKPWEISHSGTHGCSAASHRCDEQCPECMSYCYNDYNHSGNHHSKNHRNKENCIFISETENIQVQIDKGNIRYYKVGESAIPETCLQSCNRLGRAHIHLRVCKGGSECAEKKYAFARHSTKQYQPYTHLIYDEMLCKGYWNSINWDAPADEETLQEIQMCNVGCSHESHSIVPNYCNLQAWHEGKHKIDPKKCEHLGSGIVDVCFTIDTTGSMSWVMSSVSQTVNKIMERFEGKADLKYAVVSYRDHLPQEKSYVFNIDSNLASKEIVLNKLQGMKAKGGGDEPEAVMDGLYHSAKDIQWRQNSQRFIFHIGDSPPHGKKFGSKSNDPVWTEKGCPCGIHEQMVAYQLNLNNIYYYLVKTSSKLNTMESIFQSTFDKQYKQTLYINNPESVKIQILEVLNKEINVTTEFYHINEKQKI